MAALGPISLITSCMHEHEANKRVTRRTYDVGWVGGGQGTHLVGADGDVGAVHEGVALDEVVGGERVRGEGLAAGDGGVVRADVEAVAQAEEVVRRRCHSVRPFQGMHWRGSERTMDRGRRCRGRARALAGSLGGRRSGSRLVRPRVFVQRTCVPVHEWRRRAVQFGGSVSGSRLVFWEMNVKTAL